MMNRDQDEVHIGLEGGQVEALYKHYVRTVGLDPMGMLPGEILRAEKFGDADAQAARAALWERQRRRKGIIAPPTDEEVRRINEAMLGPRAGSFPGNTWEKGVRRAIELFIEHRRDAVPS